LQVLELKIQQVFGLEQCLPGEWRTRSGRKLRIKSPGIWNRGAGPDFREAVIEVDGELRVGDVEVHLYREDWWRHGHHLDPGFNKVILHAVLFAGGMEREVRNEAGDCPEEWVMGPWMREDIESVSGGEPGLFGELVPELREWIDAEEPSQVRQSLRIGADRRWQNKVSMAACIHEASGWHEGLHQMTLYYLGFPFNRGAFFEMAQAYERSLWENKDLLAVIREKWASPVRWGIGRPANRAVPRLCQYVELNARVPDWPSRLETLVPSVKAAAEACPPLSAGNPASRRHLSHLRRRVREDVLGAALGAGLCDRLWIDVFLPMLVAGGTLALEKAANLWFQAAPAQHPDAYRYLLKLVGIHGRGPYPKANGWVQGLVWMEDQLRVERIRSSTGITPPRRDGSGA
jgi:hypothetical protein